VLEQFLITLLSKEFGRVESSVTTKIKGITKSELDPDLPYDQGQFDYSFYQHTCFYNIFNFIARQLFVFR
jgi:hypothetical protein